MHSEKIVIEPGQWDQNASVSIVPDHSEGQIIMNVYDTVRVMNCKFRYRILSSCLFDICAIASTEPSQSKRFALTDCRTLSGVN